jgi:hypothetical protein
MVIAASALSALPAPPADDYSTLYDVVDAKAVVATLRESIRACLISASERDSVNLTLEQIERFARECANNAAQTLMLMPVHS